MPLSILNVHFYTSPVTLTPETAPRPDGSRGAKRPVIIAAAMRCFDREGFHRASMSMVIEEAGVSAGTVYRYFASKTDLIRACAEEVFGDVQVAIAEQARAEPTPDPRTVITSLLEAALAAGSRYGADLTRVGVSAWAECLRDPVLLHHARSHYVELRSELAGLARRWQADGLLGDNDADPEQVAQALFGALPGFIVQHVIIGDVDPAGYAAALEGLGRAAAQTT